MVWIRVRFNGWGEAEDEVLKLDEYFHHRALPETVSKWNKKYPKALSHKWKNAGNGGWSIERHEKYSLREIDGGLPEKLKNEWRNNIVTGEQKILMVQPRKEDVSICRVGTSVFFCVGRLGLFLVHACCSSHGDVCDVKH